MRGPVRARQPRHVAMPRPPLSHSRTSSVCVAFISTGSSAWRRGTRHSGPPHPLIGVVDGPETWSDAAAPSAPPMAQPAPLCMSRGQARTARAPSCRWCPLPSSFSHWGGWLYSSARQRHWLGPQKNVYFQIEATETETPPPWPLPLPLNNSSASKIRRLFGT